MWHGVPKFEMFVYSLKKKKKQCSLSARVKKMCTNTCSAERNMTIIPPSALLSHFYHISMTDGLHLFIHGH